LHKRASSPSMYRDTTLRVRYWGPLVPLQSQGARRRSCLMQLVRTSETLW